MRILLVTFTYAPFYEAGGPPVKVQAIARGLVARGHDVTVLTADHARTGGVVTKHDDDVDAVYLPIVLRYRFVPLTRGVGRFARERLSGFDVVQIFGLYDTMGPAVARRCRRLQIPYAVEPMGMFQPIVRSVLKKRVFHRLLGRRLIEGASRLIATAPQEREELLAGGVPTSKVVIRRNGVDLARFADPPARGAFRERLEVPEGPIALFLGRLAQKKHPEMALEAFARAEVAGTLVFVGPDEDGFGSQLRSRAQALGVAERLRLVGPLFDPAEMTQALVDADVFVLPSENENFGNSIAEAMACGVPVVISDRCGIGPIVQEFGAGMVVPLDVVAFASAIGDVLGDPERAAKMGEAGRTATAGLGWSEPLDETEALYEAMRAE